MEMCPARPINRSIHRSNYAARNAISIHCVDKEKLQPSHPQCWTFSTPDYKPQTPPPSPSSSIPPPTNSSLLPTPHRLSAKSLTRLESVLGRRPPFSRLDISFVPRNRARLVLGRRCGLFVWWRRRGFPSRDHLAFWLRGGFVGAVRGGGGVGGRESFR